MDEVRFDRLARMVGSRASRRAALVVLAGAGLGSALGIAGMGDAEAAKCSKKKPCEGVCVRCKQGKCKKAKAGATCAASGGACAGTDCVCPTNAWLCPSAATCCPNSQMCDGVNCGSCPNLSNLCQGLPFCGQYGPDPTQDVCGCVTSVDGGRTCSNLYGKCMDCTTDADCTTALGTKGVCLDLTGCPACAESSTFCAYTTCEAPPAGTQAAGSHGLRRLSLNVRRP